MALRLRLASRRSALKWSAGLDCIPDAGLGLGGSRPTYCNCQSKERFSSMSRASRSESSCVAPFWYRERVNQGGQQIVPTALRDSLIVSPLILPG